MGVLLFSFSSFFFFFFSYDLFFRNCSQERNTKPYATTERKKKTEEKQKLYPTISITDNFHKYLCKRIHGQGIISPVQTYKTYNMIW